jgi:hypothetical protein
MSNGSVSTFPITTFIVGIGDVAVDTGTTPPVNNCLNKMAFLGGNPAALTSPYYALASTDTSVHAQVDGIVTNSICQVDIEDGLFDPSRQIEVDFKNMPMIPPDPINGWTLNKTRLTFNGWSCTMLLIPGLKSTSNPSRYITVKQCVDPAHPFQPPPP